MRIHVLAVLAMLTFALAPLVPTATASQSVTVPATGETVTAIVGQGNHLLTAVGTYFFSNDHSEYADAQNSWHDFYPENDCYDEPGNVLDLLVDGQSPWPKVCNEGNHTYPATYSCMTTTCTISFQILDTGYTDNQGSLTVVIDGTAPECGDGVDDDGDGWTDYPDDPGCSSASDAAESPNPQCSDGVDNDGDGWIDYPADPGCASLADDAESPNPACSDGIDNDGDGLADYPADPGCSSLSDDDEHSSAVACDDGVDDDGDGRVDYPADAGCSSPADASEESDCGATLPGVVVCLSTGERVLTVPLQQVDTANGTEHRVAGYVDAYRFSLPGGNAVTLPCVTLLVDGAPVNPCAEVGGVFVGRTATLVDASPREPEPGAPAATVGVCEAEVTVTALGFGLDAVQAYAVC